MGVLGARARPDALAAMTEELFSTQGHMDPLDDADADAEILECPSHDD